MKPTPIIACLACFLTLACLGPRQPEHSIESFDEAQMSHNQVRNQVIQFMGYAARQISEAGEVIAEQTDDPQTLRNTLLWRIYAVSEVQSAGLRPDPVIALIEVWTLAIQMNELFEADTEQIYFGEYHPIALDAAHRVKTGVEELVEAAVSADVLEAAREPMASYVANNPVEDLYFGRWGKPGAKYMSFLDSQGTGALASVATMEDRISHLTMALPEMAKVSADIARWEAQLAVQDLLGNPTVEALIDGFQNMVELAKEVEELAIRQRQAAMGELVEAVDAQRVALDGILDRHREEVVASIGKQRILVESMVTREREIVLADVERQRMESIQALQAEREHAIQAVNTTVDRALATIPDRIDQGVDAFWMRAIQIGGVAFVLGGVAAFFALRHLVDRSRRAA